MEKRPPNIFLITIDSLRADHCQFLGYPKKTTPFLNSIVQKSIVFPDFYADSIPTHFAFPVIHTGQKPFVLGETLGVPDGVETVAEILKKEGYTTSAFIADNPALYKEFGYHSGFDVFEDFRCEEVGKEPDTSFTRFASGVLPEGAKDFVKAMFSLRGYSPDAVALTSNVIETLRRHQDVPIFCWIHYMDVHWPYINGYSRFAQVHGRKVSLSRSRIALQRFQRFHRRCDSIQESANTDFGKPISDSVLNLSRELYDAAINFVDSQIERLFAEVNELFRGSENFLFITSDHGEGFMKHSYVQHTPIGLYDDLIKVPLLVFSSRNESRQVIKHPLQHSDLLKMMLSVAGESRLTVPERRHYLVSEIPYGCGAPHDRIRDNRTKIGDYDKLAAVIMNGYKCIISSGTGSAELYNTSADPSEKFNILERHRDLADEMLNMYEEWKEQREREGVSLKRTLLAQAVKRLRVL